MDTPPLMHHSGWPWPLDAVQNWFDSLWDQIIGGLNQVATFVWNALPEPLRNFFTWVQDLGRGLWDALAAFVKDPLGALQAAFNGVQNALLGAIGAWDPNARRFTGGFLGWLWDTMAGVSSAIGAIGQGVIDIGAKIGVTVSNSAAAIGTGLAGVVSFITSGIQAVGAWLSSVVWGWFDGTLKWLTDSLRWLQDVINDVGSNVIRELTRVWEDTSASIGGAIQGAVSGIGTTIVEGLSGIWDALITVTAQSTATVVTFLQANVIQPILGALNWIRDAVLNGLADLWLMVQRTLMPIGEATPESAAGRTLPLMLVTAGAGFGISVLGAAATTKVIGTGTEAKAITDNLIRSFNLDRIADVTIGSYVWASYSQPIRYWYNAAFRPYWISPGQADDMLYHESITEAEWRQAYRYAGWKEGQISKRLDAVWRPVSLAVLRFMSLEPGADMVWIRKQLKQRGLGPDSQDALLNYGKSQRLKDERTKLVDQSISLFIEGTIEQPDLLLDLVELELTPDEIQLRLSYALRQIDRNRLKAEIALAKAKPIEPRRLSETDLMDALHLGILSPSTVINRLIAAKWDPEEAALKVQVETTPRPLTPTEIARRRAAAETRLNRVQRSYARQVARLDAQIGIISDALEGSQVVLSETLDVIDVEVSSLRSQISRNVSLLALELSLTIAERQPPIRARYAEAEADLNARISTLLERRDVAIAREGARQARLRDQLTAANAERTQVLADREAELADIGRELALG